MRCPEEFRELLHSEQAISLSLGDDLILAHKDPLFASADIVYITSPILLSPFMEKARMLQIHHLTVTFPSTLPLLPTLKELGWTSPRTRELTCSFISRPCWLDTALSIELPPSFTLFPWNALSNEESKMLKDNDAIPRFIHPDLPEHVPFEPTTSFGLRENLSLAGWSLTKRYPDHLRYSAFYIEPHLQKTGLSMRLMAESVKTHLESSSLPQKGTFCANFLEVPSEYCHFLEKVVAPESILTKRLLFSQVTL